jgi:TonB family protein
MSRSGPASSVVGAGSFGASFFLHAVLVGGALVVSAGTQDRSPRKSIEVVIEPGGADGMARMAATFEPNPEGPLQPVTLQPGGADNPARPDTDKSGRGGSRRSEKPAVNLAERVEGLTLSQEPTSRIDRDQLQRLHTASARTSTEDRRSLTDPMDLVFFAMGRGKVKEQRPAANRDPSQGAFRAPSLQSFGARDAELIDDRPSDDAQAHEPGSSAESPGLGVRRAEKGLDHRVAAALATGRPSVVRGPLAFAAEEQGPARDRVNSEQEVAAIVESLVHASTAGGPLPGQGEGGEEAPGVAASGGTAGAGSRALPFGDGRGPFAALADDDPRLSDYRRGVRAKIEPLWEHAFPKSASLDGRQGWAVIAFVIHSDGQVSDVRIARPSGVAEFDENVRRAVLQAAPFAPLPPTVPGSSMRWSITFDMRNPAVR